MKTAPAETPGLFASCVPEILELVVDTRARDVDGADMTRSRHTADRVAVAAEFRAKIFALHRPVATEDIFDTAAIYAAGDVLLVGCSADIDRAAAETKTGRRIDEQGVRAEIAAEIVADAATHRRRKSVG